MKHQPSPRHRCRGFSLAEIMLVCVISGILLSVCYQVFVSGARLYARGQAKVDLQSSAMLVLEMITHELRQSAVQTVTTSYSDSKYRPALSFSLQADSGVTPSGFSPGNFVIYYYDPDAKAIVRRECPSPGPGVQRLLAQGSTPASISTILHAPPPPQLDMRIVCRGVADLRIAGAGNPPTNWNTWGGGPNPSNPPSYPSVTVKNPIITISVDVVPQDVLRQYPDPAALAQAAVMRETASTCIVLRNRL